jgi:photosystem II stability/assembly factor-like uncharacterized protein
VGGLGRFVLLSAVGVAAAACTPHTNTPAVASHPVLGAPSGIPLVLGQPAPPGTGQLGAVSCADAKRCWAVGLAGANASAALPATVIIATKDGGVKWVPQAVQGSVVPQLSGISCPTTRDCIAVGSTGASLPGSDLVYTTSNGGAIWSPAANVPGALDIRSVQCASFSDCTAITSSGSLFSTVHTADFGQTWQTEGNLPGGFFGDGTLSCTAFGSCLVAGYTPTTVGHGQGAIALSTDGGQAWALATVPPGTGVLQGVTCSTATSCLAAGTTGTSVSDVVPAQGAVLYSADAGHTWTTSAPIATPATPTTSTPGATPAATTTSAPGATPAATTTSTAPSTTSSTAPASTTTTSTTAGKGAQTPAAPAPFPVDDVFAVECPSARVCVLVGTNWKGQPAVATGAVAESRDGGATFRAAAAAYIPLALSALSCPTTTGCIAVGGDTVARLTLLPPKPVEKPPIRASGGQRR